MTRNLVLLGKQIDLLIHSGNENKIMMFNVLKKKRESVTLVSQA